MEHAQGLNLRRRLKGLRTPRWFYWAVPSLAIGFLVSVVWVYVLVRYPPNSVSNVAPGSAPSASPTPTPPVNTPLVNVPPGYARLELNEASSAPTDAAAKGWLCFPARFPYDGVTCFVPDGSKPLPEAPTSASESAKPVRDIAAKPDDSALKLAWWTVIITGSAGWVTALGSIGFRVFGRRKTAVPPSSAPPPDSSA